MSLYACKINLEIAVVRLLDRMPASPRYWWLSAAAGGAMSKLSARYLWVTLSTLVSLVLLVGMVSAEPTSYMPVDIKESFDSIVARFVAQKPLVMKRQLGLLADRYDLSNQPAVPSARKTEKSSLC